MPCVLVVLTYAVVVVLLVSTDCTSWLILIFPAWVLVMSVFMLVVSLRGAQAQAEGALGSNESP
jgi:L-asparagine transporter-like permease